MISTAPHRSVLYMPGSNARALEKARGLPADAVILDLEDAVAPERKADAREAVAAAVRAGGFGHRRVVVRVNGAETPWGAADLDAALAAGPDAILLPKVGTAADVAAVTARTGAAGPVRVWAMMETAGAMLNAGEIAAAPGLEALVLGTNDLARELGARDREDRAPLATGLGLCLLAARAAGRLCIDGVYNAFRDADGLRAECAAGRDMGFDGKTLIHPAQIPVANEVFGPDAAEIAAAEAVVAAHRAAEAEGAGVAVLDGRIVERLHVEMAEATLARAAAIRRIEDEMAGDEA